ncbi:MAG TPA: glycerol-3-phosphate responsive antiterminator [Firmicutes bacterium]|nr:glycerol-3-phosphate responsive antiterminator [Bacillota bacterium]
MTRSVDEFMAKLRANPVIAGVKRLEDVDDAIRAGLDVIFLLAGTIFDLREAVARAKAGNRLIFGHVDLIDGIGKDKAGMRFLAEEIGVDGILTTRNALVRAAMAEGLIAVQRLFLLDSESLKTGIGAVQSTNPHAIEILPGLVLPAVVHRLPVPSLPPFIGGGLIETRAELDAVLAAGALGVSTSKKDLWARG